MADTKPTIKVGHKGPFIIKGGATLVYADGSEEIKEGTVALCRCGLSTNKPFCDGAHKECSTW
jgi:CDGSH-type Zn-finger protein